MSRQGYGHAITDGVVNYFSPSSLTTGDPGSYGGCGLRWWFKYVAKKDEGYTAAQKAGVALHEEIERFLTTGARALGTLALSGFQFVPEPGEDLQVEVSIAPSLALAPLRAAGVPVIGYIDLINPRGINYGANEVLEVKEDGTIEAIDWKTTGQDPAKLSSADDIARTIQMSTYGEYLRVTHPGKTHARLSHVYFFTKKKRAALKISKRLPMAEIQGNFARVESVARILKDVAKEKALDSVLPLGNIKSCDAYGGCPHRTYCPRAKDSAVERTFGNMANLLDIVNSAKAAQAAPPAAPEGLAAAMERLKAKESIAKQPAVVVTTEFKEAIEFLKKPREFMPGMPVLAGNAAAMAGALWDIDVKGGALAGSGEMGKHTVREPSELVEVARQVAEHTGVTIAVTATILPPTIPEPSTPAPVAMPALLPPDAPASLGAAAVPEQKKRGRKPKETTVVAPEDLPVSPVNHTPAEVPALSLFVDCVPSIAAQPLPLSKWCDAICEAEGELDIRCGKPDGKLGFGRWKGVIAAFAKKMIAELPAGAYTLDCRGNEIAEVVADALRDKCDLYVRGVR